VVASSDKAWLLLCAGKMDTVRAVRGSIFPAMIGNNIGGTGLFAVIAHGQAEARSTSIEAYFFRR
jgi:hypothetical protein